MNTVKRFTLGSVFLGTFSLAAAPSFAADISFMKAGFSIGTVHDEYLEFFDRDNDTYPDAITYGADRPSMFDGHESGYSLASLEAFNHNGLQTSQYVTIADMNGDGFQDLISYPFRILINNKQGHYPVVPNWYPYTANADHVKLQTADIDNNGIVDLFLSGAQRANGLYSGNTVLFMNVTYDASAVNQGFFAFEKQQVFSIGTAPLKGNISGMKPNGVTLGDFNNDGMQDVIFINSARGTAPTSTSSVTLNNGAGGLIFSQALSDAEHIAAGDLDGDGDLDLYLARSGNQADEVWFNNGQGIFTRSAQFLGAGDSITAAMADLDGDGDLDVVSASHNEASNNPHRIWLNDGNGQFSLGDFSFGYGKKTISLKLVDLDQDGDIDIVTLGGRNAHPQKSSLLISNNEVWLNQSISAGGQSLDYQDGISQCQSNPQDYGLYSETQLDDAISYAFSEGIAACQSAPHDFGLFDQADLDAQLQAGIEQGLLQGIVKGIAQGEQNCMSNPASCGLFGQQELDAAEAVAYAEGQTAGMLEGKQSCIDDPALCGLFDQSDMDALEAAALENGFGNGQQSCVDDPASCGLFNQQQVDLNIETIIRRIMDDLPKGQLKSVCKKHPDSPLCWYAEDDDKKKKK
jgi:hypothetical protein